MASLKVAVRVRPFNQREIDMGSQLIVQMEAKKTRLYKSARGGTILRDQFNDFTFDYSYASMDHADENYATQDQVYEDLGTDVIECAFQGYNACVFAYGQTGSGKTFTMMGTAEMQGLIPRICKALFARMQLGVDTGIGYKTHVSYLEIYNEKVKDLLGTDNSGHNLKVREHRVLGPYVENLSQHPVSDYTEIQQCIYRGNNLRTTASTNMNDTSSRSHAIFTITFVQADFRNDMPSETVSKIHLVDLAGSERANATGATGQRLKEGAHINKSLVTLGSVISALADQTNAVVSSKKLTYIPYRDSILTWLLKDSLGGNSKTIMIAAISPADCNYSETLSTLRYANRAKNIINKPTINEDPNVKLIRELREEINKLKSLLVNESSEVVLESSLKVLEDLQKKEAQEKALTDEWTEKWREAQSILREQKSLGLRKSGFGVVLDSEIPHLIGIHDDVSTGVTLYSLKDGETSIGTDEIDLQPDIVLNGMGILPEHCSIVLKNGNATIYPKPSAQCWLNANLIEEPSPICQGDILLLGRTNMFRFNNPAEAAKLRKDPSRSRLDLSRLSLIAASRENLNFCFHNDDDAMTSSTNSPYKRDKSQYYHHPSIDYSTREENESENENRKILETIESALGQLKFERLQMHEQYKKKVTKLKEELLRLELDEKDQLAIIECKEKELLARKEMLLWEKDNEKVQVDIIVRQLTTMQSELDLKKQNFLEFVEKELQSLQDCGKLDELNITLNEATPIEESSEVLLVISKSLDNASAQFIKDTIKKSRDDINRVESTVTEKQDIMGESSRKIDEIDQKLVEIDHESKELNAEKIRAQMEELEIRKKSLNLNLNQDPPTQYTDNNLDTFHTANSDCSILSPTSSSSDTYPLASNHKKIMSDSGVCLETTQKLQDTTLIPASKNRNELSSTDSTTSNGDKSSSEEINDDSESCGSYDNNASAHYKYLMATLHEKIEQQKAEIMKNLEKDSNKEDVDKQIEKLQELQKDYLKMELELSKGPCDTTPEDGSRHPSVTDSFGDNRNYANFSSGSSETTEINPAGINPGLNRLSQPRGNYQNEHTIAIPTFIIRGAGKQTHYEYEIRINLPDARWTLLRRYSRFRELHLHMKSCYGQKVSQIPFPRREIFSSNSETVAKQRRRQLETYLRRLLQICAKIPQSPLYEGNGGSGLIKVNLIQLSPFFKKGLFESGKHGTG